MPRRWSRSAPDSTTETIVYQRGLVVKGTLRGDLILVAAGDLTFGGRTKDGKTVFKDKDHTYANSGLSEAELTDTDPLGALNALAKQIKDAGITQVDGEILIDDRMFVRARGSGSGPDAVSPIVVNDNLIDILIEPGAKAGDPAKVTTRPETAFYQVDALVSTGAEKSPVSIQLLPIGANHFAVRGKIPLGGKPQVRIYPVEDPALFARAVFIEALRRNGVKATAAILRPMATNLPAKDAYEKMTKVASFTSPPFKEALTVTLKVSHNLYASTLPCLVAASRGYTTAETGLREERKILKELGVDVSQISFGGGAGGAPADHVTARATVQLLQGMAKRPDWEAYKAALPILGVDGTLAEAVSSSSPAKGKVFAKTGTLIWQRYAQRPLPAEEQGDGRNDDDEGRDAAPLRHFREQRSVAGWRWRDPRGEGAGEVVRDSLRRGTITFRQTRSVSSGVLPSPRASRGEGRRVFEAG